MPRPSCCMYTMTPSPSCATRSIAASSCSPQSQRKECRASPVRQAGGTRTRTAALPPGPARGPGAGGGGAGVDAPERVVLALGLARDQGHVGEVVDLVLVRPQAELAEGRGQLGLDGAGDLRLVGVAVFDDLGYRHELD